jgi:type IVB pilus formation R64 PilN family outer membrane protein
MSRSLVGRVMALLVISSLVFVSGCASSLHSQQSVMAREEVKLVDEARANLAGHPGHDWSVSDGVYLGSGEAIPLPINSERERVLDQGLSFSRGHLMTLPQVAELIQTTLGVRVSVARDAIVAAGQMSPDPFEADVLGQPTGPMALGMALSSPGSSFPGGSASQVGAVRIDYQGSLRGLLDYVTTRTGTFWEFGEGVVISRFVTRTYRITAIPGRSGLSGRLGSSSASGGGSGGGGGAGASSASTTTTSDQQATMEVEVDIVAPAAEAIRSMLSEGGDAVLMQGMGLVTVTDTPIVHDRVAALVANINEMATRQAFVDVQVVSIDLNDAEAYGINWDIVREALNGRTRLSLLSTADVPTNVNTASFAVIDPTYNYGGSSLLLQALETQGNVRVTTNQAVPVLSNAPTPINIVDEISYLAEQETTVLPESGGIQVRLTPGVLSVGFSMQMLPIILDNDDVLLQFSSTISSLRELRTVSGGGGANAGRIEVPTVSKRDTMQRVKLRSGQTLALWGFEQERARSESRGNGLASFMLGGGSRTSQSTRTVLVILVTPRRMA